MAELKPKMPVRRFDVFAEYSRLKARQEGESAAQAKGYGIWLAKVVAARKFGKKEPAGEKYIYPLVSAYEYLNGIKRW